MTVMVLLVTLALAGQSASAPPVAPAPAAETEALVRAWFDRWNQLSDGPASVDAWIQLYEPDALHTTGPASHQKGTVTFKGHEGLRALAAMTVSTTERPAYRLEIETAREQAAVLFHTAAGPWGGPSVAVQFAAVYTEKATGKRYVTPGAAFFQVQGGKIRRARIYLAADERAEVEPETKRRPG
ncbi:MAG TPA: nuclear transport factor 2 family protein [Vicinamibacterales bacterium]|nr:nuclear transport factor 2 family protein [Vicinamibacterales bacterium]